MKIPFRPLNKVHEIIKKIGYEPGYAYDDLVFSNDAVFLVQFGKEDERHLKLFINKDCEQAEMKRIIENLVSLAISIDLTANCAGMFYLEEKKETGEIKIVFIAPPVEIN